jgi:hypothetical protein
MLRKNEFGGVYYEDDEEEKNPYGDDEVHIYLLSIVPCLIKIMRFLGKRRRRR